MTTTRPTRVLLLATTVAATLAVARLFAAGPAVVMLYGGALKEPVFINYVGLEGALSTYSGLTCAGPSSRTVQTSDFHAERPYVSIAAFWSLSFYKMERSEVAALFHTLRPENAHQHGRLYLPTANVPATVVSSASPRPSSTATAMLTMPLPVRQSDYRYACGLPPSTADALSQLSLPGFEGYPETSR